MKTFRDIQNFVNSGGEALIFYGIAEADTTEEYVVFRGINEMWHDAGILPADVNITKAFTVRTTKGRKDFVVPLIPEIAVGKLALWRIQIWGGSEAGWASDYVVNYAHEHTPSIYRVKEREE
jgi:hypothetical protein